MKLSSRTQLDLRHVVAGGTLLALPMVAAAQVASIDNPVRAIPVSGAGQPAGYTIVELPCLGNDIPEINSNATGLNEAGHVVGVAEEDYYENGVLRWRTHGVIWDSDGQIIFNASDEPDGGWVFAKGINNLDDIVGQGSQSAAPDPGYIGVPKTYQHGIGLFNPDPNQPEHGWSWAINDSRQVGYTSHGEMHIYDPIDGDREFALPGYPAGWGQELWEINNAGQACGAARAADHFWHSFRYDYDTDTIVDLHDAVRFRHSVGYGINELGDIAGWAEEFDGVTLATIWAMDGREIIFDTWVFPPSDPTSYPWSYAEHINGHGDLVGDEGSHIPGVPNIGWISYGALGVGIADVTTQGAGVGDPGFGVPDLLVTASDVNFYVNGWVAQDLTIADLTTQGVGVGDPGHGVPDGLVTASDINYFVNAWVVGPVAPHKTDLLSLLSPADQLLWTRMHPFEVNEAGQICGTGIVDGRTRGFLMTPSN